MGTFGYAGSIVRASGLDLGDGLRLVRNTSGQLVLTVDGSAVLTVSRLGVSTSLTGGAFVTLNGTETLTNKTLTAPTMTAPVLGAASATSLTISATNALTFSDASAEIIPGATSLLFRNNADNATNLSITDAGVVTARAGLVATAGGVTATAGGVTVTDGGIAVRGTARIREQMDPAAVSADSNQTYTAAQLVGGIIVRSGATAGRTDTTATGTEIETELNAQGIAVATGDCFTCFVVNTSDQIITLAAGVGVTATDTGQTIADNEAAIMLFRRTGANAFTYYTIGA